MNTMMSELTNPHDRLFKEIFSRPEEARDLLEHYLPQEVVQQLDLSSLQPTQGSFVDEALRAYHSDMLYRVGLQEGGEGYVYVLFEHKSFPEPLIAFYLLLYMARIWEQALKERPRKRLPIIIPLVLYHGRGRWKISLELGSLFEGPEALRSFVPNFRYHICDLTAMRDEDIRGRALQMATMFFMKYISQGERLRERMVEFLGLVKDIASEPSGLRAVEILMRYVGAATDKVSKRDIAKALKEALPEQGDQIMATVAEQWIEEGIEKGIEKGIQQGIEKGIQQGIEKGIQQGIEKGIQQGLKKKAQEAVIEAMEARFGQIPRGLERRIKGIEDLAVLKALLRKVIQAPSLKEVRALPELAPQKG